VFQVDVVGVLVLVLRSFWTTFQVPQAIASFKKVPFFWFCFFWRGGGMVYSGQKVFPQPFLSMGLSDVFLCSYEI